MRTEGHSVSRRALLRGVGPLGLGGLVSGCGTLGCGTFEMGIAGIGLPEEHAVPYLSAVAWCLGSSIGSSHRAPGISAGDAGNGTGSAIRPLIS